jgi:hypothetical protein
MMEIAKNFMHTLDLIAKGNNYLHSKTIKPLLLRTLASSWHTFLIISSIFLRKV